MTSNYLFGYQQDGTIKLGFERNEEKYGLDISRIPSLNWLLQVIPAAQVLDLLNEARTDLLPVTTLPTLKGVFDRQPIWAAGVTYKISEQARERESANSTIYTRVYSAERPEIFWKAMGHEIVSAGEAVGIRYDATWSVPEPELVILFNSRLEVIGFSVGNDLSSRDIEGANPLYLPQAKVYESACALGPRIWLQPGTDAWPQTEIRIAIERGDSVAFSGQTSTANLNRTLPTLVDYLGRCQRFPFGVGLFTGTGVVPSDDFTLLAGDVVRITIPPIGELVNTVKVIEKVS